ncbi:hypothetical protein KDW67_34015 [Burkholderia cenocepacia]|uniref:hypothetical protein n=1 Tax=Burkholderia cenocepacia TaxID=95486 RepID=UPI000AFEE907|nr:hypothetical protein [Burkholderia cenocepacia]MBR8264994.1 hypothetical protein [Burkholderia cenocepacia]
MKKQILAVLLLGAVIMASVAGYERTTSSSDVSVVRINENPRVADTRAGYASAGPNLSVITGGISPVEAGHSAIMNANVSTAVILRGLSRHGDQASSMAARQCAHYARAYQYAADETNHHLNPVYAVAVADAAYDYCAGAAAGFGYVIPSRAS